MKFKIAEAKITYKPNDYYYIDRLTGEKKELAAELKRKPIFQKTKNEEFNKYAQEFYKDFQKIKDELLAGARTTYNDLNVIDVDISGSFKKGTPNEDSDLDVKIFYTDNVDESVVAERMEPIWSSRWGIFDVHPQRVIHK